MGVVDTFSTTSTATGASLALTVPRAVSAGSSIVLSTARNDNSGSAVGLASITDSRANTWALTDAASMRSGNEEVVISHAHLTTGLQVGDTITVTWNATSLARHLIIAHVATGLNTGVGAQATSGTTLTLNTSTGANGVSAAVTASTGATTSAQCLVVAATAATNQAAPPFTAASGYTSATTVQTSSGTNDRALSTEYKTTSAAGVQTAGGSWAASTAWAEAVAAYPLASAVPTVDAGPDQVHYGGELVVLQATVTGTTTGGSWSQVSGTAVTLTSINSTTSSFVADLNNASDRVRVFRYTATYAGGSVTDDVQVTVPASSVLSATGGAYAAGQGYTA